MDDFSAHQTPPNLNFACPQAKKRKICLSSNKMTFFCSIFVVASNLIERLELHSFLTYLASSPDEG